MFEIKRMLLNENAQHRPTTARLLRTRVTGLVCSLWVMTSSAQAQWQDADLTALAGGPSWATNGVAIAFDPIANTTRTHYFGYSGPDFHVHELYLSGSQWQDADLTAITGAPIPFPKAIAIAFDPVANVMRTHYFASFGMDWHLHELFVSGGQWQDADLTALAGGPAPEVHQIAMAFDPVANSPRTHYARNSDRHVHELFLSGMQWQDTDLTAITGGPGNPLAIAMAFDPLTNGSRTHYVSYPTYQVHELFVSGGQWQEANVSAIAGAPPALTSSIAMAFDPVANAVRTYYVSQVQEHVHELLLYVALGYWQDSDLTAITGGPVVHGFFAMATAFDPVLNGIRTHYVSDSTRHVHELALVGGQWQDADLTAITGGPDAGTGGIAIAYDPIWNCMRTHYQGGLHIHELSFCY